MLMELGLKNNKKYKIIIAAFIVVLIIATMSAVLYFKGAFLPKWIDWNEKSDTFDVTFVKEGENYKEETYHVDLKKKQLSISFNDSEIWKSQNGVLVQDYILTDIDGDGIMDIVVLFFRRAQYGNDRPFFVTQNDKSWSQHIGIYSLYGDNVKPRWVASDIGMLVESLENDGSVLRITDINGNKTSWIWKSFGLKNVPNDFYL